MLILLTVLKVIGITLLVLLGLLLLIVLLVLFVPVRFSLDADIDRPEDPSEDLGKRAHAVGRATWLLHLVRARFVWPTEGDAAFTLYVLFFRLIPRREKKRRAKRPDRRKKKEEVTEETEAPVPAETGETGEPAPETDAEGWEELRPGERKEEAPEPEREEADGEPAAEESGDAQEERKQKRSLREKIAGIRDRIREFLSEENLKKIAEKPQIVVKKIDYTICGTYAKIQFVRATTASNTYFRAKQLLLNQARRVIRHILPRKCRVNVVYGADDPAKTADMVARVAMLYPILEERVKIVPVFDEETLYGTARIRGRIRLSVILWALGRLYFSRDIRAIRKRMDRFKEIGRRKPADDSREVSDG